MDSIAVGSDPRPKLTHAIIPLTNKKIDLGFMRDGDVVMIKRDAGRGNIGGDLPTLTVPSGISNFRLIIDFGARAITADEVGLLIDTTGTHGGRVDVQNLGAGRVSDKRPASGTQTVIKTVTDDDESIFVLNRSVLQQQEKAPAGTEVVLLDVQARATVLRYGAFLTSGNSTPWRFTPPELEPGVPTQDNRIKTHYTQGFVTKALTEQSGFPETNFATWTNSSIYPINSDLRRIQLSSRYLPNREGLPSTGVRVQSESSSQWEDQLWGDGRPNVSRPEMGPTANMQYLRGLMVSWRHEAQASLTPER